MLLKYRGCFWRGMAPWVAVSWVAVSGLLAAPLTAVSVSASPGAGDHVVAQIAVEGRDEARYLEDRLLASGVDVWAYLPRMGHLIALLSGRDYAALQHEGYSLAVDVERTDQLRRPQLHLKALGEGIPGFPCYRTVEETYRDLARIAASQPRIAEWRDIGDSWEKIHGPGPGYDLHALVLTNKNSTRAKTVFLLDASIHAREYATAEMATRFAEYIARRVGKEADVTWLLDHVEIHIIPFLNPDGRKMAERGLLWRKNVNNNFCGNTELRGIDLNRNNSFFFAGQFGNSNAECSLIFRGPSALSEPEAVILKNYMERIFPDQRGAAVNQPSPDTATGMYVTLHSFGEFMIYPFEGISQTAANDDQLRRLSHKLAFFNGHFVCRRAFNRVSGITTDMAYGEFGVGAVLFELGRSFFQPCAYFETTIVPRNLQALVYAAKVSRRPFLAPAGPDVVQVSLSSARVVRGQPLTATAEVTSRRRSSNGCGTEEPLRNLRFGLMVVDAVPWEAEVARVLDASDGEYDGVVERITEVVDTSQLELGRHTLYFYAADEEGNLGVPTAVFFDVVETVDLPGTLPGPEAPERPARPDFTIE